MVVERDVLNLDVEAVLDPVQTSVQNMGVERDVLNLDVKTVLKVNQTSVQNMVVVKDVQTVLTGLIQDAEILNMTVIVPLASKECFPTIQDQKSSILIQKKLE